jgi:hypothetical protein
MGMTSKGLLTGTLAVAAVLSMAGPSAATLQRGNRAPTSVTISSKVPAFSGSVRSKAGICRKGRRVKLLKRTSGGDPKLLGRDISNTSGDWAVRLDNVRPGAYFARTGRRTKERNGSRTVCRADRSRVVVVD